MNTSLNKLVPAGLRYWDRQLGPVNRLNIQLTRAGQVCVNAAGLALPSDRLKAASEAMGRTIQALQENQLPKRIGIDVYRALFESLYDGHGLYGPNGFIDCNATVCEMLRCKKSDIIGRSPMDFMPELQPDGRSSAEIAQECIKKVLAGEKVSQFFVQKRMDGTTFESEVTLVTIPMRGKRLIHATMHDISEKAAAEAKIKAERHLIETVINSIPGVNIFVKDTEGRFTLVNKDICDFLGRASHKEVIGKTDFDFFPEEMAGRFREQERKVLDGGEEVIGLEEEAADHKGDPCYFLTNKVPLRDREGHIIGLIGININITARKQLEQQFLEVQRMEALGALAGGVAHDFNNMLMPILGYADMIMADAKASAGERFKDDNTFQMASEIVKAGLHAQGLAKQVLDFSRRSKAKKDNISMVSVAGEVLSLLRNSIPSTIEIRRNINCGPGMIFADPTQMNQVLMNILVNAKYAIGNKCGAITINMAKVMHEEIPSKARKELKPGAHIKIEISDTGHGMTKEVMSRIFEPRFTTKAQGQGTGLGLSTVKGIVHNHEGAITVKSTPGKGSVFTVFIPMVMAESTAAIELFEDDVPGGTEHILVVDDEQSIRGVVEQSLLRKGYKVTLATCGEEALLALKAPADPVKLVLTDLTMPNMNGLDLAKIILERFPGIPVVLQTGQGEEEDLEENAHVHGITSLLYKPFNPRDVQALVREVLDNQSSKD